MPRSSALQGTPSSGNSRRCRPAFRRLAESLACREQHNDLESLSLEGRKGRGGGVLVLSTEACWWKLRPYVGPSSTGRCAHLLSAFCCHLLLKRRNSCATSSLQATVGMWKLSRCCTQLMQVAQGRSRNSEQRFQDDSQVACW